MVKKLTKNLLRFKPDKRKEENQNYRNLIKKNMKIYRVGGHLQKNINSHEKIF